MTEDKLQKLIVICFELVLTCTSEENSKEFNKKSNSEKAEWVAHNLRGCGFDTTPAGMSWGVLNNE